MVKTKRRFLRGDLAEEVVAYAMQHGIRAAAHKYSFHESNIYRYVRRVGASSNYSALRKAELSESKIIAVMLGMEQGLGSEDIMSYVPRTVAMWSRQLGCVPWYQSRSWGQDVQCDPNKKWCNGCKQYKGRFTDFYLVNGTTPNSRCKDCDRLRVNACSRAKREYKKKLAKTASIEFYTSHMRAFALLEEVVKVLDERNLTPHLVSEIRSLLNVRAKLRRLQDELDKTRKPATVSNTGS